MKQQGVGCRPVEMAPPEAWISLDITVGSSLELCKGSLRGFWSERQTSNADFENLVAQLVTHVVQYSRRMVSLRPWLARASFQAHNGVLLAPLHSCEVSEGG